MSIKYFIICGFEYKIVWSKDFDCMSVLFIFLLVYSFMFFSIDRRVKVKK